MNFLPKHINISFPFSERATFPVNTTDIDQIKHVFNSAWKVLNNFILSERSKTGNLVSHHRGSVDLSGDHGYFRVAAFISLILNTPFKGRIIMNSLPRSHAPVYKVSSTGHTAIESSSVDNLYLPDDIYKVFEEIYNLPDLQKLNISTITVADISPLINKLATANYIDNTEPVATLYNTLILYIKTLHDVWLKPTRFENGHIVDEDMINVKYTTFNVFNQMMTVDGIKNMFSTYLTSGVHNEVLHAISELSGIVDGTLTPDGFKLSENFFNKWTDKVFDCALSLALNYFEMTNYLDDFFVSLPKYVTYMRLHQHNGNILKQPPKSPNQLLIIDDLVTPIDTSEVSSTEFISNFEGTYDTMISLFCEFVDNFFTPIINLQSGGSPNICAYYSEIEGKKLIYGMVYSSPYQSASIVIERYEDGDEYGESKANTTDTRSERIRKIEMKDETYQGINTKILEEEMTNQNYLEVLVKSKRHLIVTKREALGTVYDILWNDTVAVLIPPVNPVSDFKFDPKVLPSKCSALPDHYHLIELKLSDIKHEHLPFLVKLEDYSDAKGSTIDEVALDILFNKIFNNCLKVDYIGYDYYVAKTAIGRGAILNIAALLAPQNLKYAEQAVRFLQIKVDDEALDPVPQGAEVQIKKKLFIPFPFNLRSSTSEQILNMQNFIKDNPTKTVIDSWKGKSTILGGDGYAINTDIPYHPFTDIYKLGVTIVDIESNFIPKNYASAKVKDNILTYNMLSMTKNYANISAPNEICHYFGKNEMDFVDPYPRYNFAGASIALMEGVLTDIIYDDIVSFNSEYVNNFFISARTLRDVVDFWKNKPFKNGYVHRSVEFDVNITWSELADKFSQSYETCSKYLEDRNSVDINTLKKHIKSDFSSVRGNNSIFWNQYGFSLRNLFFGDVTSYLNDKMAGRAREELKELDYGLITIPKLPQVVYGTNQEVIKQTVVNNLKIVLTNTFGKLIFRA